MTQMEAEDEIPSALEQEEAAASPLQALANLIEEHHALLAFSAETPITFAHPAISVVREVVRLGMLVLEEDADFLQRVIEQFNAPRDCAT